MSGNMEQNPSVDPSSQQFRQQLNQWFEQHGVLDNLRSHLRSVMIAALQQTEFRLRPHQKTTPKIQSMNLLIAEYLLSHGCHYTLSILMSELPALANFASGAILFHCTPKTGNKNKPKEKYRFQENEVIEILNSLGVSSRDEVLKLISDCYEQNRNEESLLECLLRFIPKMEPEWNPKRYDAEIRNAASGELSAHVSEVVKKARENPCQALPRQFLSKISEEESEKRMRELFEREKRIQDYLKRHEEEMIQRLLLAERELDSRRETIDKELSERQLHLGRIAFQLKDKHSEIMELSRNFAAIKSENVTLRSKLDGVQVELNELREELEKKSEIIERLEAERMSMKCHVQEYLKWKSRGGTVREAVTSNLHDNVRKETKENNLTSLNDENKPSANSSSSQDSFPSTDESRGEEALLDRVKARVELLENENARISEKYMKYKKKYENRDEDEEVEESPRIVPHLSEEELITVVEEPPARDTDSAVRRNRDDVTEACHPIFVESPETTPRRKMKGEEERKIPIPTKRQQKNLDYYLESRNLLEALEKSSGLVDGSASTSDLSLSSRIEEGMSRISEKVKIQGNISFREIDTGLTDLSDFECLTLLKEATRPVREERVEGNKGDEGG